MRDPRQRRSGGKLALSIMIGLLFGGGGKALASPRSEEIAERLSGAIRFETVSPEDPDDFDPEPFEAFAAADLAGFALAAAFVAFAAFFFTPFFTVSAIFFPLRVSVRLYSIHYLGILSTEL